MSRLTPHVGRCAEPLSIETRAGKRPSAGAYGMPLLSRLFAMVLAALVSIVPIAATEAIARQQNGNSATSSPVTQPAVTKGQSATLLPDGRWMLVGGLIDGEPQNSISVGNGTSLQPFSANLQFARSGHTATVLPNGTVLVFGGTGVDDQLVPIAEVIDPLAGSVQSLTISGLQSRTQHTATLMTDGAILFVGGIDSVGQPIAAAQLWDSQTNTVASTNPALQSPRYDHNASLLGNGVDYISGGNTGTENSTPAAEQFNPSLQLFEPGVPPPQSGLTVADSVPSNGAADVPVGSLVAVRFSQPVDIAQLNAATVTLVGPAGAVGGTVVGAEGGMLAFFKSTIDLLPGSTYTLFLNGVNDPSGVPVPLSTVRFRTQQFTASPLTPSPGSVAPTQSSVTNAAARNPSRAAVSAAASRTPSSKAKSASLPTAKNEQTPPQDSDTTEDWLPHEENRHGQWRVLGLLGDPPFAVATASRSDLSASAGTTALAGHVLRLNGQPIAGVQISAEGQSTTTDAHGHFLLMGISAGAVQLKIDGTGVTRNGRHYTEHYLRETVTGGRTTVISHPIYLPRVDPATEVSISSPAAQEIVLTHPAIPGLEVHIPRGAVIRKRDGSIVTQVSITPVPLDRPPYPTPVPFSTYFTLQPGGAYIDGDPSKAIKVIYPNYDGLSPGSRVNFWNYDPSTQGWVIYGHGTVSSNGKQVIPDNGVGFRQIMSFGLGIEQGTGQPSHAPVPNGTCAGDPVDCATGLFSHTATDLVVNDVVPISITRMYRTNDNVSRSCGVGCNLSYSMWLSTGSSPNEVDLIRADGSRIPYFPISGSSYPYQNTSSPTEYMGSILTLNTTTDIWNLTLRNGTVLRFRNDPWPNQLLSISDRNGNTVTLAAQGGSTTTAASITQITSPNGRYIQLSYDSLNRLKSTVDNAGRTTSYTYDSGGHLYQATDSDGYTETYGYDPVTNNMNLVTDKRGNAQTQNDYHANGQVKQQTLADGAVWKFSYVLDGGGNVTQTTITDPRGYITQEAFNSSGYMVSQTLAQGQPEQQVYVMTINQTTNLLQSVLDPFGRTTQYSYDAYGDVKSVTLLASTLHPVTYGMTYDPVYNQLTQVTDPLGHATFFGLDTFGNVNSITDALGYVTSITNNGQGLPTLLTDPLNHTIGIGYQGADLSSVTDGLGRTSSAFTDALGRITQMSNPIGNRQTRTYDPMNRVTGLVDPLGNTTGFSYDKNGNLLSVTDPRGAVYGWSYDVRNRVQTYTTPDGNIETRHYDGMGNLSWKQDAKQQLTQYVYDGINRLKTITYADGSTIQITWDAGNRATTFVDSINGTITRTFNGLDQLTDETTPQGEVQYTPDAAGRRMQMTVVGQSQPIKYGYDNANRLLAISQGTVSVGIHYDNANRLQTVTLPNGIVQTYGFDAANQLQSISYDNGATHIGDLAYTYDGASRRNGQSGSLATLVMPSNPAGTLSAWASATYTWNARDQLVATSWGGTGGSTFSYDALGRRTSKTIGGVTTSYQYDGLNPVMVNGSLMLEGLGLDQYFARITSGTVTSFLTDALGSTIALTNSSAATTASYAYGPYGNVSASGSDSTPFQFTGRENDGAANLYYYRARYYNPTFGQFISADPIGLAGGINPYAYVGGNPISYVDPRGENFAAALPLGWWRCRIRFCGRSFGMGWSGRHRWVRGRLTDLRRVWQSDFPVDLGSDPSE